MHLLTVASLRNRALIALVTIVAAVFGTISMGALKQELMPSVQFPAVVVVASYPGASPEVVNHDLAQPIETALRGVPKLERTTATSSTGAVMVLAEFTYGVDLAVTEQKVERAISRISRILPDGVEPQVASGSFDDFPVIQIAATPGNGGDAEALAALIERLAIPDLEQIDGVRSAEVVGARGDRVTIRPDADRLAEEGLSPQAIRDALQQSGVLLAAGTVTEGDRTLAVQAGAQLEGVDDIASLPLVRSPEFLAGQAMMGITPEPITIADVAKVSLEPNPERSISRVDGAPALTIAITKLSAANTVDVSQAVREMMPQISDQLDGATLNIVFDQAPYIERSIHTLTTEGMLGLLFAIIVILIFLLSIRATLVTAISIPTSVLLAFIAMNFAEYSLNILTLGALTISIGRVVDDSIVVIENIKRHLGEAEPGVTGEARSKIIVTAVREVAAAITASTVTTVAVFLPMAFVAGMVGELFRPFAFTVTIALAASLLVALTIVPVLAYWFIGTSKRDRKRRPKRAAEHAAAPVAEHTVDPAAAATTRSAEPELVHTTAMQRGYLPIINWTLKHPAVTLIIAALVFGGTIATYPLMKTNFIGSDEQNSVGLTQTLKPGVSLEAQLAQAERVEKVLADISEIETVQVTIGSGGDGMAAIFGGGGDGVISYSLTTDENADQAALQERVRSAVEKLSDAGEFAIAQSGGGMTGSSAIQVSVSAPDQKSLAQASDAVVAGLKKQDGLVQIESDLATSRPYLAIVVDRAKASEAGLSEVAIGSMVAQRMQPGIIGQIVIDSTNISVYMSNGEAPASEEEIAAIPIQTMQGEKRLDDLATVKVADGPVTVRAENGNRIATVSALPASDDLGTAGLEVSAALETIDLPTGTTASVGGVLSQQQEAFEQLGIALLAAILIVYVVMVATFKSLLQPLLLLVSVPFAATGAILLLVATGNPLGVASLIGVLMLIGIVVTNAIVLIDLVNQLRERGEGLHTAVVHGSSLRLRPIVMTALATILALTPMGIGLTGSGGFISQPLALVVIGGLFSSTLLTLIVLPTLYFAVEHRRENAAMHRSERRAAKRALLAAE